ncbi:MAG: hypothetical protein NVSMB68_13540 [Thermoanaerobaculia bacterium]
MLHTFPVKERDKLVIFLTPDHGKLKGWAYGARSARSRFGASLEPMAKVMISFREREGDEIVRIESVDLIRSLFAAQQNLVSSIAATFIAEMIDTFALPSDPAELLFRLLDKCAEALLGGGLPQAVVAYAEIWTLRLAGIFPSTRECIRGHEPVERPLRYDDVLYGFVCAQCAGRDASIVSNDVAEALELIQRTPVLAFSSQEPDEQVLFEVRALSGSIRRHFLGRELKSFDILMGALSRQDAS